MQVIQKRIPKRKAALALAALISLTCSGCQTAPQPDADTTSAAPQTQVNENASRDIELSLWTYPVGGWGEPEAVEALLSGFHQEHPNIHISVEYLDYSTGDEKVNTALAEGQGPDLIFEGPERLVAQWGEAGPMVDLSDLWLSEKAGEISSAVRSACRHQNGNYYEFPICMTAHCMAINYDLFKAADALQYLDETSHTWTRDGFIQAVNALHAYGHARVAAVYCKDQGGDQGTRALITNLGGGSFTDADHTAYTFDSQENIDALRLLFDLEGITFDPTLAGGDEIDLFCKGELAMAFCWNVSLAIKHTADNPNMDFEVLPMAFPTNSGDPKLQGGIWGLGIFDHGDPDKIEAAKTFISFITEDDEQYADAVLTSSLFPVRDIENLYAQDELMDKYSHFTQFMGDYYQTTPGWSQARFSWWNMLQDIGGGKDITTAAREFTAAANAGAKADAVEIID